MLCVPLMGNEKADPLAERLQWGSKCDLRACNRRVCRFEQTGRQKAQNTHTGTNEGPVPRFLKQKTFKNYRELLAKERAETERMFFIKVLTRKEAETRRRSQRAGNNG
jgi:hypothetical protein